jgi:hypothetical protein
MIICIFLASMESAPATCSVKTMSCQIEVYKTLPAGPLLLFYQPSHHLPITKNCQEPQPWSRNLSKILHVLQKIVLQYFTCVPKSPTIIIYVWDPHFLLLYNRNCQIWPTWPFAAQKKIVERNITFRSFVWIKIESFAVRSGR